MTEANRQLPLEFGGCGSEDGSETRGASRGHRVRIVRMVEYAPFPRVSADQEKRVGFTRDESMSGMCLGVNDAEPVGELLRVIVRGVDGRPTSDFLARVAWCEEREGGRHWVGLEVVSDTQRHMLRVRHSRHSRRVAVTA